MRIDNLVSDIWSVETHTPTYIDTYICTQSQKEREGARQTSSILSQWLYFKENKSTHRIENECNQLSLINKMTKRHSLK